MKKKTKKIKKKRNFWIFLIGGAVLALALGQLFISHRLATTGEVIREFEVKATRLEQANLLLKEEIGQMGSLSRIAQEAEALGLVRTANILYLTPPVSVALGANVPVGH